MCNRMVLLAETGTRRYVSCCEHGTLHLGWSIATVSLNPADFLKLKQLLEQGRSLSNNQMRIGAFCLAWNGADSFILSIADFDIRLGLLDFFQLLELAQMALEKLGEMSSLDYARSVMEAEGAHSNDEGGPVKLLADKYLFSAN